MKSGIYAVKWSVSAGFKWFRREMCRRIFFGRKQKREDVQVSNKKVEELGFMLIYAMIIGPYRGTMRKSHFVVLEKQHVRSNLGKLWSELLLSRVGMVSIVILRPIWQQ